jgi:hypothetical protein
LFEVHPVRRRLQELDGNAVGVAQVERESPTEGTPRDLDGLLASQKRDATKSLDVSMDVVGPQTQVRVADVVRLHVSALAGRNQVLDELEDAPARKVPERRLDLDAVISDDLADVRDVEALPKGRALAEKERIELDRPIETRNREADMVETTKCQRTPPSRSAFGADVDQSPRLSCASA